MDSIQRDVLDRKIAGWEWVRDEFDRLRTARIIEADRLLGPDRGE